MLLGTRKCGAVMLGLWLAGARACSPDTLPTLLLLLRKAKPAELAKDSCCFLSRGRHASSGARKGPLLLQSFFTA